MQSNIALVFFAFMLGCGLAGAAATCASGPFKSACSQCPFDASGKMDAACWEKYQGEGKTCLGTSYPKMAFAYTFGDGCPQLDECVSRLTACKEAQKTGSDARDCNRPAMIACFTMADACAEAANKVCADGKSEEEAGFNNITVPAEAAENGTQNETTAPSSEPHKSNLGTAYEIFYENYCKGEQFLLPLVLLAFLRNRPGSG